MSFRPTIFVSWLVDVACSSIFIHFVPGYQVVGPVIRHSNNQRCHNSFTIHRRRFKMAQINPAESPHEMISKVLCASANLHDSCKIEP